MSYDRIDTSVAHPARRYDYWLGGKDNFAADRESGDEIAEKFPAIRTAVVEHRRFLRRRAVAQPHDTLTPGSARPGPTARARIL